MEDAKQFWVGFNLVKGIGPTRLQKLLDFFGDIREAWLASGHALAEAGLNEKLVSAVQQVRQSGELSRLWESILEQDIEVLTWDDDTYPRRLREIDQSPPVIYLRGSLSGDDQWAVAIVGTRRITAYGKQVTSELARTFANRGITIISGLARGVDGVAHQAALDGGGRSLAVLGCGVDRIYPPEHRHLAERVISHGALLSDYPPGTEPEAANFPPRNRIISGLAYAVVVVEAGDHSGALITATFAAEQGREVFAVPGSIYAPQSKGTNLLIHEGAHILLDAQDVLEMLNFTQVGEQRSVRAVLPANATEAQLFSLMSSEPLHVDELHARSDLPIEEVSAALSMMELKGLVRQVGGMRYVAIYELNEEYEVGGEKG